MQKSLTKTWQVEPKDVFLKKNYTQQSGRIYYWSTGLVRKKIVVILIDPGRETLKKRKYIPNLPSILR